MAVNLALASKPIAQDAQALRQVFARIHAESCPTTYNFHMHTRCSDGQLHPEELMEQAMTIGLQGLAITDHHSVEGYWIAQRWLEHLDWQSELDPATLPHLWVGVEVTSMLLDVEVHILGYAFDPSHAQMQPYLQHHSPQGPDAQAGQVIGSIQAAGGLAVLAHPMRYRRSVEELIPAAADLGINGVEAFYAYDNPRPWRPSPAQTQQVQDLSAAYQLLHTCGTDSHGRSLLQRV